MSNTATLVFTVLLTGIMVISAYFLSTAELDRSNAAGLTAAVITVLAVLLLMLVPRRAWLLSGILLTVLVPVVLSGFLFSDGAWGISDWDYYFSLHENIRRSLLTHHAFPFWNPYTCGGTAGLGDPEFSLFTPTFLLEIIFGIPLGLRLAIYLSVITGALGMLVLGKRLGLSVTAAFLAALILSFGSVNLLEIVEGHPNIFAAGWIPWIFWSWLGAYRASSKLKVKSEKFTNRWTIACGFFLALTFYQGGIYLLMYTGLAFLVLPLLTRKPGIAYLTVVKAGLWALGLAALKLIPVLLWLRQFQDTMYAGSASTLPHLHQILFGRYLHDSEVWSTQGSGWHEYGAYIGYTAALLALVSAVKIKTRLVRALWIGVVTSILLSSAGPLFKPFFDQVSFLPRSNISRVILFAIIPLSLLAGTGLDIIRRRLRPVATLATVLLCGLVAAETMTLAHALSLQAFVLPPVVPAISPAPAPLAFIAFDYKYRHRGDDYTRAYAATLAGYGTLTYCSPLTPPPSIRTIHDKADNEIIALGSQDATYSLESWSPNSAVVDVTAPASTEVILNTNYARGWYVNQEPAREIAGRVGTIVPAGQHQLTFRWRTPGFIPGVIITAATGILMLYGAFKRRAHNS